MASRVVWAARHNPATLGAGLGELSIGQKSLPIEESPLFERGVLQLKSPSVSPAAPKASADLRMTEKEVENFVLLERFIRDLAAPTLLKTPPRYCKYRIDCMEKDCELLAGPRRTRHPRIEARVRVIASMIQQSRLALADKQGEIEIRSTAAARQALPLETLADQAIARQAISRQSIDLLARSV